MKLCLARAPPQVCAPTRHNHQFCPFVGYFGVLANLFQDPCVPDGCIYQSTVFLDPIPNVSFDIVLGREKISKLFEIFTPKS